MNKTAILAIRIIGDAAESVAAFKDAEDAGKDFERSMDQLEDGVKVAGAAAGVALVAGFYGAVQNAQSNNKLAAQLGADAAESERLGGIAGQLYADAYGESLDQVNEAIRGVIGNIDGMATAADADLERITQRTLSVSQAFDQDLGQTTTAVGQMIRTGLAKDADEALDLITRGLQGNARAADDLLDTYTEYPALFQRLGIDGQTSMGLIKQGMDAGARSTDLVADALKEFQIRSTDASTASAAGYEALGLDAAEMTAQMARGGADAAAGLDIVLDRLREMTDPVAQNAAAVALFGTQAEDLGGALFALDPSSAVDALGEVTDAAARLDEQMSKDQALTVLARTFEQTFTDIGAAAMPVIMPVLDGLSQFAPIVGPIAIALAGLAAGVTAVSGAMKVYAAAQAIQTAAQWASNAAWLASPITWIVLAIVAAVALVIGIVVLLIQHWDDVQRVAGQVWGFVLDTIRNVGQWFGDVFDNTRRGWDYLVQAWNIGFDRLTGWIRDALRWLGQLVDSAVPGWVKDLIGMGGQTFTARMVTESTDARSAVAAADTMARMAMPSLSAARTSAPADAGRLAAGAAPTTVIHRKVEVTFTGLVSDKEGTAREIRRVLEDSDVRNGRRQTVTVGR